MKLVLSISVFITTGIRLLELCLKGGSNYEYILYLFYYTSNYNYFDNRMHIVLNNVKVVVKIVSVEMI